MKKILVCATGMTPQIVSESLYALIKETPPFIPDEIHIISTTIGLQHLRSTLLGKDGALASLCSQYHIKKPKCDATTLHVITDKAGNALEDIRSVTDNSSMADTITTLIRGFCNQPDTQLHVSLAGGRKTMVFFMGYALSLFGRAQDRLSHVLVNQPFESNRNFFFPPRIPENIATQTGENISTDKAEITLADIPFVRLREVLPDSIATGSQSYSQAVTQAQTSLINPSVTLDSKSHTLFCNGIPVKLEFKQFVLYQCIADAHLKQQSFTLNIDGEQCYINTMKKLGHINQADNYYRKNHHLKAATDTEDFIDDMRTLRAKINQRIKKIIGFHQKIYQIQQTTKRNISTRYTLSNHLKILTSATSKPACK